MGKLEEDVRKTIRRTRLQEAILVYIASGGKRGTSALVPEILNSLLKLDIPSSARKGEVVRSIASRLTKKGLLKFENKHYSLTQEGEEILEHWRRSDFKLTRPKRWDNKWRIVIFDIPEKKRAVRDEVRNIFVAAGFKKLQNSVWVYPYDCEDVVGLLKNDFKIGRNMLYIIADQIENDKYLREEFGLTH